MPENEEFDLSKMQLAGVTVERSAGPKSTFALRLEGDVIDELRQLAEARHVGPTQLVRTWVLERLEQERRGTVGAVPHALRELVSTMVDEKLASMGATSSKGAPTAPTKVKVVAKTKGGRMKPAVKKAITDRTAARSR